MPDSTVMKQSNDLWMVIRLNGIQDPAGKCVDKASGRACIDVGVNTVHRLHRPLAAQQLCN